jgi:hypothetical protein
VYSRPTFFFFFVSVHHTNRQYSLVENVNKDTVGHVEVGKRACSPVGVAYTERQHPSLDLVVGRNPERCDVFVSLW